MIDPTLLDVACPLCHAGPLEPCTANGRYMESTVHFPRRVRADVPLEEEPKPKTPRVQKARKPPKPGQIRTARPGQPLTHCRNGHEYTEANTYHPAAGYKKCRTCDTDAKRKLREARGVTPRGLATHCKREHEYTPENTYRAPNNGSRRCIACRENHRKTHYAKKKEMA